ncbi:hypothetical protein [Flavisolibacter ginsenosidimutans]|uniref:Uncharacterized protein n=1 Tax=Flavisolibacter ginsenosidimutans TaxID=661481 RepID=A0A5B8UMN1_9BACT|nr:hypothetical protein [Flavisolibacter ginsenosidimutans]QEC57937.1 hypothetical protein FSB75_19170 [Flavisolibacter ginsenosidimutans]
MTVEEFTLLPYAERLSALTEQAVCVAGRDLPKFKVLLYQLGSFYVEVFYHVNYNYITELMPFDSTDLLSPYLANIPLPF